MRKPDKFVETADLWLLGTGVGGGGWLLTVQGFLGVMDWN